HLRQRRGAAVHAVLHHQTRWHGHRARDLPLHHRIPRRTPVLRAEPRRRMHVRLQPAGCSERMNASRASADTDTPPDTDPASPLVYLVDDNHAFRRSTALLLETSGIEVRDFEGGTALLSELETNTAAPEAGACVVSDVRMPDMSGLELLEELKRRQ